MIIYIYIYISDRVEHIDLLTKAKSNAFYQCLKACFLVSNWGASFSPRQPPAATPLSERGLEAAERREN